MQRFTPDRLQKIAVSLMAVMVVLTFMLANIQALLWQSSDWLVGAVLPSTVVQLTNEERSDVAASPLRRSSILDQAASLKAQHMAQNGYFAHFAPDGTSPWFWFDTAGYSYAHAGENLAVHFTDSDEVVEAWMNSPTHRANIVDRKFTEIGVGTARGTFQGHRTVYVVQLFGTPAATAAVPANNVATAQAATPAAETPATAPSAPTVAAAETTVEPENTTQVEEEQSSVVSPAEPVPATTEPVSEEVIVTEAVPEPIENPVPANSEMVVMESMVATSSGLAAAESVITPEQAPATFLSLATQPNTVMQVTYTLIALAVFMLLVLSLVNEFKHAHPVQMGYSVALLLLMVSLYWLHTTLTEGAIVV